ncbi:hypothetical protein [Burkholderia sp. Bp8990]|uniref:hypothetical protein n=1 Tax=Burkholderia sp. Bp8990 TaxID=2184552 RepID=UPI001628A81B|nr:hypothetical protein [Burkholderia sp. Bp8990]
MAEVPPPSRKAKDGRRHNTITPTDKAKVRTRIKSADGLTPVEEAYARARAFGMTQLEAVNLISGGKTTARGAGAHYEKKPHVLARIDVLRREISERAIQAVSLDRQWVLKRLMTVAERCMQAEPVLKNGESTGEYKFDSAGANRALELLGKELGMFVERKQVDLNPLTQMSDEDLMRVAAELAQQTGMAEVIDVDAKLLPQGATGETLREQDAGQ